jgi:hypothetical protein
MRNVNDFDELQRRHKSLGLTFLGQSKDLVGDLYCAERHCFRRAAGRPTAVPVADIERSPQALADAATQTDAFGIFSRAPAAATANLTKAPSPPTKPDMRPLLGVASPRSAASLDAENTIAAPPSIAAETKRKGRKSWNAKARKKTKMQIDILGPSKFPLALKTARRIMEKIYASGYMPSSKKINAPNPSLTDLAHETPLRNAMTRGAPHDAHSSVAARLASATTSFGSA